MVRPTCSTTRIVSENCEDGEAAELLLSLKPMSFMPSGTLETLDSELACKLFRSGLHISLFLTQLYQYFSYCVGFSMIVFHS